MTLMQTRLMQTRLMRSTVMMLGLLLIFSAAGAAKTLQIIVHWPLGTPQTQILQKYVDEYNEINTDGVEVVLIGSGEGEEGLAERALTMLAAGDPPAAIHADSPWLTDIGKNLALELPSTLLGEIREHYLPIVWEDAHVDGRYYGFRTEWQVPAMIYDTEILGQAGIAVDLSTSMGWDETMDMVHRLSGMRGNLQVYGLHVVGMGY